MAKPSPAIPTRLIVHPILERLEPFLGVSSNFFQSACQRRIVVVCDDSGIGPVERGDVTSKLLQRVVVKSRRAGIRMSRRNRAGVC